MLIRTNLFVFLFAVVIALSFLTLVAVVIVVMKLHQIVGFLRARNKNTPLDGGNSTTQRRKRKWKRRI